MTYVVVFGDLIRVPNLRIAGIILTLFRVVTIVLFLWALWRVSQTRCLRVYTCEGLMYTLLLVWIVWAVISVMVSPYSEMNTGLKESLSLILGAFSFFIYLQIGDEYSSRTIIKAFRKTVLILLAVGVLEIATGYHLAVSRLAGLQTEAVRPLQIVHTNSHLATGIFYNENDLCCFLTILSPTLFYCQHDMRRRELVFNAGCVAIMLIIFVVDDANIAVLCTAICLLYVLWEKRRITTTVLVLILVSLPIGLYGGRLVWTHVSTVLFKQIGNFQKGVGSLSMRTEIYRESWSAFIQTKGLGVGAGGFSNYIRLMFPQSRLVNPHCWWLEILSTYGAVIFLLYCLAFLRLFKKLSRKPLLTRERVVVTASMIAFALAGFIPSSFLGYQYQWALMAMGYLEIRDKKATLPI